MALRKLNKKDYVVGQIVALRYEGNASRGKKYGEYELGLITKIGNRILYIDNIKIDMESGSEKTVYSSNYKMYDSEQHLLDTLESEKIIDKIRNKLGTYSYPDIELDKLKEVVRLLEL